jgi:hypothetical protein
VWNRLSKRRRGLRAVEPRAEMRGRVIERPMSVAPRRFVPSPLEGEGRGEGGRRPMEEGPFGIPTSRPVGDGGKRQIPAPHRLTRR